MIDIEDQLHAFDTAQLQHLRDRANAYGIDIKLTVSDGSHSRAQLEQHVASRVTGRKQISIGVDPKHHFTFVRGSRDLGLPSGPEIASAGNSFFRTGDLVGGIDAIAARANSLKSEAVTSHTGAPIIIHQHTPPATTSVSAWWYLGGLGVVVLAVVGYVLWRNAKREREAERLAAELNNAIGDRMLENAERGAVRDFETRLNASAARRAAPAPRPSYSPYPYPVPTPAPAAPVIVNQGGGNDMLTNMLLFDALTDHHHHHDTRVIERERVVERDTSSSSWDSGGGDSSSSSSWDSSSDSSSSSDWGGGDSGGGFDSGGGGSDW